MTQTPDPAQQADSTSQRERAAVARGSTANLVGAAMMAVANLGVTILVTRTIATGEAGVFFSTTSLFVLASTLGMMGTNTALVYFVARSRALGRHDLIPRFYRVAALPVLILGVVMAVAMFAFAAPLADLISADHPDVAATYLRVLAVCVPFAALENVTLAATRGLGIMRATVLVEQIARSALQVAAVGLALIAPTAWALGAAWAGPYLPASIAALMWWNRASRRAMRRAEQATVPAATTRDGADKEADDELGTGEGHAVGRRFWSFSAPRALASAGQVTIQRLDIILVAALATSAEAAIYAAATRFLVVGQMANRAISTAVQPRLAERLARQDTAGTNDFYRTSTGWLILIVWPAYLMLLCFGSTVMTIFGQEYVRGAAVLAVLAGSMLIASATGMVDMVLNMGGRTSWNLVNVMVGLGVNIGLDLWLIPQIGMMGAAIGWAVAIIVQNLLAVAQTGLLLGLHPISRMTLTAAAITALCFGGVGLLGRIVLHDSWVGLILSGAVGCALYVWCLRCYRGPLRLAELRPSRRGRKGAAQAGRAGSPKP